MVGISFLMHLQWSVLDCYHNCLNNYPSPSGPSACESRASTSTLAYDFKVTISLIRMMVPIVTLQMVVTACASDSIDSNTTNIY